MELVNEASKPSFRSPKLTHRTPPHSDQFWTVSGDEFSIKDLLDFSTDPVETLNEDKTTILNTEFSFPAYDIDDLEWVSQFVNDSFSGDSSLTCPVRKFPERKTETETETVTLVAVNPLFKNLVHKKARSKRRRTGGSVWSLRSSSPMTDSSTSSSSNSSCTSRPLLFAEENLGKPEKRKRPAGTGQLPARRCSHCFVQKTPQWRAGPLGAKTLCNACGVRFKSGRLLPEYRPACSPTFSSDVHSNSHRKVLEMRQKKAEAAGGGGGGLAVRSS